MNLPPTGRLPTPEQTGYADLGDHRLEFVRFNKSNRDSPSLVLLHEGLGSVAMWRNFPARLASTTGAEVIAYSRRGYGRSSLRSAPCGIDFMHREARETLPILFRIWDIDSPILVGHSDGASIALIHAAEISPTILGAAVMAPHIMVEPISLQSIELARKQYETTDLKDKLGRYHDDPAHAFHGWNDAWLNPNFLTWDIRGLLPNIHCPVLAIQGENDAYGTMAQINGIRDATSGNVELLKLPACGHSPHRDKSDETLTALKIFVDDIKQGTA